MIIAHSMSSVTVAPSSPRAHRSWALSALHTSTSLAGRFNPTVLTFDITKERIKKLLSNVELSVSSYDTAWVAMVPSPDSPKSPCFPQCLNWLMDNQLNDGSWGLLDHDHDHHMNPPLLKDALSSTLACIVALKRWDVGEDQINKGLQFIESNFASATDKNQTSPFGFDIIFPGMLEYAQDLNINLPIKQTDLSLMLNQRDFQMTRFPPNERGAYLAYISEGLRNINDWNFVMKYQMKNGSLFNSPSATAAVLIHHQNVAALNYLNSLLNKFGNAVPTVYPFDLSVRLSVVDTLERLGITRHFKVEIQNVLDETYRCWLQRDEEIFMDVVTCALAFRLLRINGYQVSLDPLFEITKKGALMNSHEEPFKDVYSALEVYKASQIIYQDELTFEEQNMKSADFLKHKLSTSAIPSNIHKEVDIALIQVDNILKFPLITTLERISTRRNIEHYNVDNTRISKTAYRSSNISNEDYLTLAVEDFNACQSIHRQELKVLERWVVENKFADLKFARQKIAYCYLSAAATLPSPELSDARICWAKNACFTAMIDDFFDFGGSIDEMVNLIQCIEKWNVNVETDCCSEDVRIIFLALKGTICWVGETAFKYQGRDVTSHVIQIWLDVMKTWLTEAIWARDSYVPTMDEYMENGYVSMALGPIVLPALYFIGPKLSEEIVQSSEYHNLFKLVSNQGRLLNDIQTYKLELEQGKLNALTLKMRMNGKSGSLEEEEVAKEIKMFVKSQRREMMKLVLEEKGSIIPRAIKDGFWNMANVMNFYYGTYDGVTGNEILDTVKEIIYEPVSHPLMLVNGTKQHS